MTPEQVAAAERLQSARLAFHEAKMKLAQSVKHLRDLLYAKSQLRKKHDA